MRAILFDLDNTLVDRDGAVRRWLARYVDPAEMPGALELDAGGRGPREPLMRWLAQRSTRLGSEQTGVWTRFTRELPSHVESEPATLECLRKLGARFEMAVVTNGGGALQRAKLAAAGLGAHFESARVFVSGELGVDKPAPRIYRHALGALGLEASDTLFVGDDALNDVAAPAALGMHTCWVHGAARVEAAGADYEISHVSHLAGVLP